MPIQYTSPYNLPYPQIGDPVRDGQANMELLAKRVNQILIDGTFPAATPDLATITTLTQHRRMEFATTSTFAVSANTTWDIGAIVKSAATGAGHNAGADFATRTGAVSGQIIVTEAGFYTIDILLEPTGSPGDSWLKIQTTKNGSTRTEAIGGNNALMWESYASLGVPVYLNVGDKIRGVYRATVAHSINSRLTVAKVGELSMWGTPS